MKCSECSNPVRPVVAIDIDGTLAQWHFHFVQFAEKWLDVRPCSLPLSWNGHGEFSDWLGIPKDEYHRMKLAFRSGGFKRWMPQFPLAWEFMIGLSRLDVEVWLTTTRPWQRMDNIDPDTREWLRRNAIPYHHLLFDEDKYGQLCDLVDPERIILVLDDEGVQRDRCQELGLPFVLRRSNWNHMVEADRTISEFRPAMDLIVERMAVRESLSR